jgi:KaiC/GvpD/RAD55 family RecA-like ATPase
MISNNSVDYKINDTIRKIHESDLDGIFDNFNYMLKELEKDVAVRIFSNVLRIFLLKDGGELMFIKKVMERFENDYDIEHPSRDVALILIKLLTSEIEKSEALNSLLNIAQNKEFPKKDRAHAFIQFGDIFLSSRNSEQNLSYFEELDKLIDDEEYIVNDLNYDNITLRFNYDEFEITLKTLEMKLMAALSKKDKELINKVFEEIIETIKKLKEEKGVTDDYYMTSYSVAKMKTYTGEFDLELYFNRLYDNVENYKGFIVEGYYEYLKMNYPHRIDDEFKEMFKSYWKNYYEKEEIHSKKAFLYTALDYLTGYAVVDFVNIEELIEEIEKEGVVF